MNTIIYGTYWYDSNLAKFETSGGRPLMCHDSTIIDLWVAIVASLAVLVVKDDSLITLLDIVLAAIVGASILKGELIAAVVIGRTILWEGEFVALGVVVGERVRVGVF